jgi:hypothetical protein
MFSHIVPSMSIKNIFFNRKPLFVPPLGKRYLFSSREYIHILWTQTFLKELGHAPISETFSHSGSSYPDSIFIAARVQATRLDCDAQFYQTQRSQIIV